MKKLKVFVVAAGFHDAYVAAPSRKAALAAWGSEHDLFARGIAHEVSDPALMEEPLAHPGEVIRRSRGSAAEQFAALPPDVERAAQVAEKPAKAATKPTKPKPKPSRDALEAAERAASDAADRHRAAEAEVADKIAAIEKQRRALNDAYRQEETELSAQVEAERARYDAAIEFWRRD